MTTSMLLLFATNACRWMVVGCAARIIYPRFTRISWLGTWALGFASCAIGGGLWYLFDLGQAPYRLSGAITATAVAVLILVSRRFDAGSRFSPAWTFNTPWHYDS